MEGARMIDEWPIIEKRVRSYDMVFRKKLTDQEIVVVGAEEADDVDFDAEPSARRRKGPASTDKIRISQEEKSIYDLVDGTMTVREILEVSRFSEFDTAKALYELLTRDLIEEVKGASAAAVVDQAAPLDETEVAETPVPLPLVALLALLAIVSIGTSFKNPLNALRPLGTNQPSAVVATMKSISMSRLQQVGEAIEKYNSVNGRLPNRLQDLAPAYIAPSVLRDPWGHSYNYLPQPQRYLVIGYTPDDKPDTDLLISHAVDAGPTAAASKPVTGGIQLVD